ncbi:response regulator [Granulicella tundricola]|uniref:response regulator n=1 Tax=Granulicella tundricola TaxID=940615 RepID=UPI001E3B5465|nr:response regulator transcription factor [Granulicella tundricola]
MTHSTSSFPPAEAAAPSLSVLIVDDHPMVREGLAGILMRSGIEVAGLGATGRQAIELFQSTRPDVVLLDLRLPDSSGVQVLREIRALDADARVVMLTSSQADAEIYSAMSAGASGYLLKGIDGSTLVQQLRHVASGGRAMSPEALEKFTDYLTSRKLSEREIEVLRLVAKGNSNKEIAAQLFVTEDTIKVHVRSMLAKLHASDRTQAVVIAIQRGLLEL